MVGRRQRHPGGDLPATLAPSARRPARARPRAGQQRAEDRRLLGRREGHGSRRSRRGIRRARQRVRPHRRGEGPAGPRECVARLQYIGRRCPVRAVHRTRTRSTATATRCISFRVVSVFPIATTTSTPTTAPKMLRSEYVAHVARMFRLLGDDSITRDGERDNGDDHRDRARGGLAQARGPARPDQELQRDGARRRSASSRRPSTGGTISRMRESPASTA